MRSAIRDQSPHGPVVASRVTEVPVSINGTLGANATSTVSAYSINWLGKRTWVKFEGFGQVTSAQMNGRFYLTAGALTIDSGYALVIPNGGVGVQMYGPILLGTPPAGPGLINAGLYMNNAPGAWSNWGYWKFTLTEEA